MKFKKIAGIASVGVVVLVGAFLTSATSQASSVRGSAPPSTPREAYAIQIRTQMGFESDLPYIRSLESRPGLSSADLGTPVTASEQAELVARAALGSHVNAVGGALSALPSYAGVWFDQVGDGAITVALTSPPTAAVTQLVDSVLPANSAVSFVQVPLSYSQLNALYQSIGPLSANGITNVGLDTVHNTVAVGVATQAEISAVYATYGRTGLTVAVAPASTSAVAPASTSN